MKPILFLLCTLFMTGIAAAQRKTLDGVYAGLQVSLSVTPGGAMGRSDNTYLFRPDGTFNHLMNKPDWKTRVTGNYEINGQNITLHYTTGKGGISKFKFTKDGEDIDAGSYNLLHMAEANRVPAGTYEFHMMNSMGGGSSGMVYVGAAADKNLYFDGKGHFTNNSSSASVVSGANVGGGSHSSSGGQGSYQIKDGVLVLTYNNGKTETHSFFSRPSEKPIMAVVDGNIFFMEDDKGKTTANTSSKSSAQNNRPSGNTPATVDNADGKTILLKANAAHGGASLDNIKTVRVSGTIQGIQVTTYIDVAANRLRVEARQGQKLVLVDQLEGQSGWHWQSGQLGALSAVRIAEMRATFNSGILGLRKSVINRMEITQTQNVKGNYSILTKLDGNAYGFVINGENRLIGEGSQAGQTMSTSALSDYRQVSGVWIPFQELQSNGRQKINIQYTDFQINQPIDEAVWNKPAGS